MRLLFIYNAHSGSINALLDAAHKIVSPATYNCKLCQLTHGHFGERNAWKEFIASSKHEFIFYHKDEFESNYSESFEYPIILIGHNPLKVLFTSQELDQFQTIEELMNAINDKSDTYRFLFDNS